MKKDILTLIIGILIGAVITVSVFIVLKKTANPSEFNRTPPSGYERGQFEGERPGTNGDESGNETEKASEQTQDNELNKDTNKDSEGDSKN